MRAGAAVVELGCWPGSWLQVLAERVGAEGRLVGVDVEEVAPLPGVVCVKGDFTEPDVQAEVERALGRPAQAVLSDAAPKLTGVKDVDRAALGELYEAALALAARVLAPDGALVVKGFPGPESDAFRRELRARFARVSEVRPEGKRGSSQEFYWVATPEPTPGKGRRPRRRRRG